ncbi:MAG: SCO family protein [Alphaproteobacteria bacterium]|nr:SCO family protein [Alphaproteobacteria bacterium]
MKKNIKISIGLAAAGLLTLLGLLLIELQTREASVRPFQEVAIGGAFSLTNEKGEARSEADFAGAPMLIYFGFTYCPDVCPMSLDVMGAALETLEAQNPKLFAALQPVFISVDPLRDTPEQLSEYLSYFHPKISGLTGTPEQIAMVKKAFRVYAVRRDLPEETAQDKGSYNVDHSSFFYLMDGKGRYLAHFDHGLEAQILAQKIAAKLR